MTLSSSEKLGQIIGGLVNKQTTLERNLSPDELSPIIQFNPLEQVKVRNRWVVTKNFYPSNSFILDHPVYGELDSSVYELDGGYTVDLSDGLVAFYNLAGDANDSVGSNHGTVSGATLSTDKEGRYNGAYSFSASQDIEVSDLGLTGAHSAFAWIKTNDSSTLQYIIDMRGNNQLYLSVFNGNYVIGNCITACSNVLTYTIPTSHTNNWVHIGYTLASATGTLTLYLNGVAVTSASNTKGLAVTTATIALGNNHINSSRYIRGSISSVGFWNRALSATEVERLYMGGYVNNYPLHSGELHTVYKTY